MKDAETTPLEAATLAITEGAFELDDAGACLTAVRRLLAGARREVAIVSRHLDPALYRDDDVLQSLRRIATGGRGARIRILILDPTPVIRHGHPVVELVRRTPSASALRIPGRAHRRFNEAWLIADTEGFLQLPQSDRYAGLAAFSDRRRNRYLQEQFDAMWEQGREDPNLRQLAL